MLLTIILFYLGQMQETVHTHFQPERTVGELKNEVRTKGRALGARQLRLYATSRTKGSDLGLAWVH